jgi:DNA-binding XRE family transcriptional regulator
MNSERLFMDDESRMRYMDAMTENLPVLRSKLGITQANLAERVGCTRHTLMAVEKRQRTMTWNTFLSLLLIFTINPSTSGLVRMLEISDDDLSAFLTFAT